MQNPTIIDKLAMGLSGALLLLGIVVLGVIETAAGKPYGAAPLTNEAGDVVAMPLIDPNIRVGLVLAGLLVLALYGAYRFVTPYAGDQPQPTDVTAD